MNSKKYTLGLVSISFRQHSPKEIIKAVKNAGLACIEWGSDVHAPCKDLERLNEIASLQKEYGISCSSYGTYFRLGDTPIEELTDYINAAKILGTKIIRLWCGTKSGDEMTDAEKSELLAQSLKVTELAEKNDVILCMECHCGTFTQNSHDSEYLMKAVNSPNFRMYWQSFQWLDADGNFESAEIIAPYAEHIHVFNWHGDSRFPLCEATEDWRRYLSAFTTPRTLLLEFMPDDKIETLSAEADALKAIAGEA